MLVAFSPDGQTVISASQDGMVRLWEAATGKEVRHVQTREDQTADGSYFAVSRDGSFLASVTQGHSAADQGPDLPELWNALAGSDGAKAYQAIWRLAATPSRTVRFLKEHLHPVKAVDEKKLAKASLERLT